mgnify:CR=1 FL=1
MQKTGFTLLELSIVLVIIGLIVGGVTVGSEMIRQAELSKVVHELQQIETAMHGFKLKYNALPGDLSNAKSYWPDNSQFAGFATPNGNGDGVLAESNTQVEKYGAWQHLALSGFMTQSFSGAAPAVPGVSVMGSALEGGAYQFRCTLATQCVSTSHFGRTGNFITLATMDASNTNFPVGPLLSTPDAQSIDAKMDDGIAHKGRVFGVNSTLTTGCSDNYTNAGADYQLTSTGPQCRLSYWY